MSTSDMATDLYHLESTVETLRRDLDAMRAELSELKQQLVEETRRRRTLSARVDSGELVRR